MRILLLIWILAGTLGVSAQSRQPDEYWTTPRGTYEERRALFLDYYSRNGGGEHPLYRVFHQITRVAAGFPLEEKPMQEVFAIIRSNRDCNDFALNGLLRLAYMDRKQSLFPEEMKKEAEACILDFKYWWDDGRRDTTYRCYHTENHQALYHTAELLAGQLYKKTKFANGMNGRQHIAHAKERLLRWLEYRFRFGFSEWMSTYYDVEVLLLANLYDFAEDKEIRRKAGLVLDLLMFDVALNNYQGFLGSASGRNYAHSLITGAHNTAPLVKLVFGMGTYDRDELMAPVALSTSSYRCPEIIRQIATDQRTPLLNRQRVSINVEEASDYGLSCDSELDCHLFWGMQEFVHPMAVRMSKQISEKYDVWPYRDYDRYIRQYDAQVAEHGQVTDMHVDRFALSEANIETWRTADYMLSCALDYRKGAPGYQQHVWQATLGNKALVYTNHPGGKNLRWSPNYWAGNEILPRAAQHRNVVVCIYNIPSNQKNGYTHAYFPVKAFDEVHLSGSWIFGRKGEGYVALYSGNGAELKADDRGEVCDFLAPGRQNVWLCEVGAKSQWGSFAAFVEAVSSATVKVDGLNVSYASPSEGTVSFGWDAPFLLDGQELPLRWNCRYDNPYCKAAFDTGRIEIVRGDEKLVLDYGRIKN